MWARWNLIGREVAELRRTCVQSDKCLRKSSEVLRARGGHDVEILGWSRVSMGRHRHSTNQNMFHAPLV